MNFWVKNAQLVIICVVSDIMCLIVQLESMNTKVSMIQHEKKNGVWSLENHGEKRGLRVLRMCFLEEVGLALDLEGMVRLGEEGE